MSGYVPGYLYSNPPTAGGSSDQSLYTITVNGITVVTTSGVQQVYPLIVSPTAQHAGRWWVNGDVSNINGVDYTYNDPNNYLRDEIADAFISLFNRFPEPGGTEFYVDAWLNRGGSANGSVYNMVSANAGTESAVVASNPYQIPYTYFAPQYGCTDPAATNYQAPAPFYQRLFTTNPVILTGGACTYPLPTASLSASPTQILRGNSSTLTWSTSNSTSVSIDNGIGAVAGSGSISVSPTQTTTYTITASSAYGTVTSPATVTIANSIYVKDSTVWKKANSIYVKDAGSWKLCNSAYIKQGGVWKQFLG